MGRHGDIAPKVEGSSAPAPPGQAWELADAGRVCTAVCSKVVCGGPGAGELEQRQADHLPH